MDTLGSLSDKLQVVNNKLWHQEEIAHALGADDKVVAAAKRNINILNNQRNDLIQEIDELFVKSLIDAVKYNIFPKIFYQCKTY